MEKRYPRTILATACVPWGDEFNFEEGIFRKQVSLMLANGIRCIYLFGTAGEGYAVSRGLYRDIVIAFLDEMKKTEGAAPMVGVISLSMPEVIERIELGMELGATDFQISFPSWGAVTPEEGMKFILSLCKRFPDARFMHYNNYIRSKTRLEMKHYVELSKEAENLVAVKNPSMGIYDLTEFHGEELPIRFFNLEMAYGYASMFSEAGFLMSYCNLSFAKAWEYFNAGVSRDFEAIVRLHREIGMLIKINNATLPGGKLDGSYDKLFVKAHIPEFPQRLLPPYEGVSDEDFERFIAEVRAQLPGWA